MLAAWIVVAIVLTGCNQSDSLGQVSGQVTFRGEPVSEGLVLLVGAEQGIHVTAEVRPDGTFDVVTLDGGGLPPGSYQVGITPPRVEFPIDPSQPLPIVRDHPDIPAKYRNTATSQLTINVQEGENRLDIDMQP